MPIFDQGYQHWNGTLSGHAWRWLAIARHGFRAGMKNRMIRYLLFVSWGPALALAAVLCAWGLLERKSDLIMSYMQYLRFLGPQMLADPRHYRMEVWTLCYAFFLKMELYSSMVLILLIGPNLISQDLRFNALPLYFSRPLRRIDYFLGKLGVIGSFLALVVIAPSLIAWILGLLFSLDFSLIRDTFPLLLASMLYGLVITVSAGLLILALSSVSRSSRYVAMLWVGLWFVSAIVATVLQGVDQQQRRQEAYQRVRIDYPRADSRTPRADATRRQQQWSSQFQHMREEMDKAEIAAAKTNWRPMVSYVANLDRVGQHLLGTEKRWKSIAMLSPAEQRDRLLLTFGPHQYPWYWSAFVLVGLFGFSVCILNLRVRSLDRLR